MRFIELKLHSILVESSSVEVRFMMRGYLWILLMLQFLCIASANAEQKINSGLMGPSTSTNPYLVPVDDSISFVSILSAGDRVGYKKDGSPWKMVGIPDGLGAFDNAGGTMTVLINHEVREQSPGIMREHGQKGAFITKLIINKDDLKVIKAEDQIKKVIAYNSESAKYYTDDRPLYKLCSGDLSQITGFYDPKSGLGYKGRIFLSGEEVDPNGRAFAHFVDGEKNGASYELAWMGNMAFENLLAHPGTGQKTVVAITEDAHKGGEVYFYVGKKQVSDNPVEQAGLAHGDLYVLKIDGLVAESTAYDRQVLNSNNSGSFSLVKIGDVSSLTGEELDRVTKKLTATVFLRPEDGAWDTVDSNRFYFNTTADFDLPSRIWALDFSDILEPEKGGIARIIYQTGKNKQHMLDNMTVAQNGEIIVQEDPGDNEYIAEILKINPRSKNSRVIKLARHDEGIFNAKGLTTDEESSGVIDVTSIFGKSNEQLYLLTVQAHSPFSDISDREEVIEHGQLLLMRNKLK